VTGKRGTSGGIVGAVKVVDIMCLYVSEREEIRGESDWSWCGWWFSGSYNCGCGRGVGEYCRCCRCFPLVFSYVWFMCQVFGLILDPCNDVRCRYNLGERLNRAVSLL
jgi:hypothetical protein